MRKRTFMDPKFSAGDANSQAYRDSWDRMFADAESKATVADAKLESEPPPRKDE